MGKRNRDLKRKEKTMQREFPLVIRKTGEKFVPEFPIELEAGDQFIIVKEIRGSQVLNGQKWILSGYTASGPVISKH